MPYGFKYGNLGKLLKKARKEKGYSQREFAKKIGTSKNVVYLIENNMYNPTIEFLDRYAKGLEIRMELTLWM